MISLEKWEILTPLQKLPKNVGDLGKLVAAKGFKNVPTVQEIAQSGHTEHNHCSAQPRDTSSCFWSQRLERATGSRKLINNNFLLSWNAIEAITTFLWKRTLVVKRIHLIIEHCIILITSSPPPHLRCFLSQWKKYLVYGYFSKIISIICFMHKNTLLSNILEMVEY